MEKVFIWRDSKINYITFGRGQQTLICFHGYGQDCHVFEVFEPSLTEKYRVVSIDLPYQGKTIWNEKEKLSREMLVDLMSSFLRHVKASEKVSLMAYSIGGNYAMGLAAAFPEKIAELWLLAADGLKSKPAFDFITKTGLGRMLFKNFVLYPSWVFYSLRIARFLGITDHRVINFYYSTMDSKLKREALFDRWSSTARISIHPKEAIEVINKAAIATYLIFGKKDGVISYKNAVRFSESIPTSTLVLTDSGHRLLVTENNSIIAEMLSSTGKQ